MTGTRLLTTLLIGVTLILTTAGVTGGRPLAAPPHPESCVAGPHNGHITADEEWCVADNPHIISGEVTVDGGVVLTLEPGVIVQTVTGARLTVLGHLEAAGSAAQPILLTSSTDSSAAKWGGLNLNGSAGDGTALLRYVTVRYGGDGVVGGGNINVQGIQAGEIHLEHCRVEHGFNHYGMRIAAGSAVAISDTTFDHNGDSASDAALVVEGSVVTITNSTIQNTTGHGIQAAGVNTSLRISGGVTGSSGDGINISGGSVTLVVNHTDISNNSGDGIDTNSTVAPTVHLSTITGNGGYGIINRYNVCLDASYNYWGDDRGPLDSSDEQDGCMGTVANTATGGEEVSDHVYYYPWLGNDGFAVSTLTVTQTALDFDGPPLEGGEPLHYTIVVSNSFPLPTYQVAITETFPAYTTYIWDSDEPNADVETSEHLVWLDRTMYAGANSVEFMVIVRATAAGRIIRNVACIQQPHGLPVCSDPLDLPVTGHPVFLPVILRYSP